MLGKKACDSKTCLSLRPGAKLQDGLIVAAIHGEREVKEDPWYPPGQNSLNSAFVRDYCLVSFSRGKKKGKKHPKEEIDDRNMPYSYCGLRLTMIFIIRTSKVLPLPSSLNFSPGNQINKLG